MPDATRLVILGSLVCLTMMFLLWLLHLRMRNAAVVDVGWTAGLGILALLYAGLGPGWPVRRAMVAVIGGLWSWRLAAHLAHRVANEPEDGRYQEIRARWGGNTKLKFLFFFLFQGVIDVVLSVPFLAAALNARPAVCPFEIAGVALWVAALAGESIADRQLRAFKANPANKGRVCQAGLWHYSRHPNYFFEWLVWCAFFVFALGSPSGWLAIIGPVSMLYLLLRVTGIPATEQHAVRSRGAEYVEYQRTTSAFVPWPRAASKG